MLFHYTIFTSNILLTYFHSNTALILGLRPANERRRYKLTPSLIGWAQTYNQSCNSYNANSILPVLWTILEDDLLQISIMGYNLHCTCQVSNNRDLHKISFALLQKLFKITYMYSNKVLFQSAMFKSLLTTI